MTGQGTGRKTSWAELPQDVVGALARIAGGEVVGAASEPDGFSRGLAARLRLADGRRVFVKATSALADPAAAAFHRREIAVTRGTGGHRGDT